MVNRALVDYIRQNKNKYPIETLKQSLLKQGFSSSDVKEAVKTATAPAAAQARPVPPALPARAVPAATAEGLSEDTAKILATLSYLIPIISLVTILIAKPKDKYARYHGFQALFWYIGVSVIYVASLILTFIIGLLPYIGSLMTILGYLTGIVFWLAAYVFSIIFAIQAYQGKTFKIPLISSMIPADARY